MPWEPRFISTLKNVRGVVYFAPDDEVLQGVKWLSRHFRYRYVELAPSLGRSFSDESLQQSLSKKPFTVLAPPSKEVEALMGSLAEASGLSLPLVESLLLASCYVSPLLLIGEKAIEERRPLILYSLAASVKLSDMELKRHLRIADYGVLDLHQQTTQQGWETIIQAALLQMKGESSNADELLASLVDSRREVARLDCEKRYWRLRNNHSPARREVVVYVDPCLLLSTIFREGEKAAPLSQLLLNSPAEVSICFALITGFMVETG